jgi:hypothetical protein
MDGGQITDPVVREPTEAEFRAYRETVEGEGFERDELASVQRGRRYAIASALGLAGLLVWEKRDNSRLHDRISKMATDKQVTTIVVGQDTGASYVVRPQDGPPPGAVRSIVQHMVREYVYARERWNLFNDAEHRDKVNLCSTREEQARFAEWYRSGEDGPHAIGAGGWAEIEVRGEPDIKPNPTMAPVDLVEWTIVRTWAQQGQPPQRKAWKLNIYYGWDKGRIGDDVRLLNPFGFVVTNYQRLWT